MQVAIFSKKFKKKDVIYIQDLFNVLYEAGIIPFVYAPYYEQLKGVIDFRREVGIFENHLDFSVKKIDFFITLGGDGTILDAVTLVQDSGVPIMGINLGRLGFLASIEKKRIEEAIQALQKGMYTVQDRQMLYLESNFPLFAGLPYALNDFTLLKRDTSSMITVHTYINGAYLNSYWADGLIIATPVGSTAYSLSCGGPIIFPGSGNFVITPVAPHNLNVRPIVIPDDSVLSFEIEGRTENYLCTLDSRFDVVTSEHQLAIRKNDFPAKIVQLHDVRFMETLHKKLQWGTDARN
jgi:NAD+ kinase